MVHKSKYVDRYFSHVNSRIDMHICESHQHENLYVHIMNIKIFILYPLFDSESLTGKGDGNKADCWGPY